MGVSEPWVNERLREWETLKTEVDRLTRERDEARDRLKSAGLVTADMVGQIMRERDEARRALEDAKRFLGSVALESPASHTLKEQERVIRLIDAALRAISTGEG